MQLAIRYFTKSKKGNTKKIADYVASYLELEPKEVSENLEGKVDVLFLINAMYAADIDKEVKDFLKENKEKIACLVNINSSASGASTLKAVKKVADKEGIAVSEKEFHTQASWIFINKGRPNDEDFARLGEFLKQFKAE